MPGGDNETAAAHESSFIGVGFNWIEASRRGRTIRLILLIYFIFDLIWITTIKFLSISRCSYSTEEDTEIWPVRYTVSIKIFEKKTSTF